MKTETLQWAAKTIAARNLTEKTVAVTTTWDNKNSRLVVTYYFDGKVTDDDEEISELALTELLAEFPDVVLAESHCIDAHDKMSEIALLGDLVYCRK